MDRWWLLTWTAYGQRLPGDARGSTIRSRDATGARRTEQLSGASSRARGLHRSASARLRGPPVQLDPATARTVVRSMRSQAEFREWSLIAAAVMKDHVHVVIGVPGDPDPDGLLHILKSYASRELNAGHRRPASGAWWTRSSSARRLRTEAHVRAAVRYVRKQPRPLALWVPETG